MTSTDATERLRLENARNIWKGMQESGSEKLSPEHAEAAAALWDATLRGYAYDTGELVEDRGSTASSTGAESWKL